MSEKRKPEELLEQFDKIYPGEHIEIIEWNGYTKPLTFKCGYCGRIHKVIDARQILNKAHYCSGVNSKNKNHRFTFEEYQQRINRRFDEKIEIIEYRGLSTPVKYLCPKCHQIKMCNPARTLITRLSLCDECYGIERNKIQKQVDEAFKEAPEFKLITWRGATQPMSIKCLKCNNIFDRDPRHFYESPHSCPFCNSGAIKQRLNPEEMQKRIDKEFGENQYLLLEYAGQLQKTSKIKCLSCGLIFETQCSIFTQSRGCPKCKRYKSKGEQKVQRYLEENNIKFEAQKRFSDCNNNLSSFDFCAYDKNNVMHLIEVNGKQHYFENNRFEKLEVIQRRDKIKIDYCKEKNIDLIIIPYSKLSEKGIDNFLSFLKGSTTIPEGSRE